jgi:hypothetical protein
MDATASVPGTEFTVEVGFVVDFCDRGKISVSKTVEFVEYYYYLLIWSSSNRFTYTARALQIYGACSMRCKVGALAGQCQ